MQILNEMLRIMNGNVFDLFPNTTNTVGSVSYKFTVYLLTPGGSSNDFIRPQLCFSLSDGVFQDEAEEQASMWDEL